MSPSASVKSKTKTEESSKKTLARALLGRSVGFKDCEPSVLDDMIASGRIRQCAKGECVFHNGEPFDSLGVLISGSFESSITRADGHRHLVALLQPGDVIGLVPLLDGLGHVNDLWARSASTLLLIQGADVRRLRALEPGFASALDRQLTFRIRLLYGRLTADPAVPLDARVAGLLQTLCKLYGLPRDNGTLLNMRLTQTDLADWLGVSRQRINFVVKQLEADGVIQLSYSAVTVCDNHKLAVTALSTRND